MPKRKVNSDIAIQDPSLPAPEKTRLPKASDSIVKAKKPKVPKITIDSDPTIAIDHDKISALLSQKKTWRYITKSEVWLTEGKLQIIFQIIIRTVSRNASIYPVESSWTHFRLKTYLLCPSLFDRQDAKLTEFLAKYEKEKFAAAAKELGKSARGVQKRIKQLKIVI